MIKLFLLTFMAFADNSAIQIQALRLHPGQDIRLELEKYIKDHKIKAASVLSAVGSLNDVHIRFANKPDTVEVKGPLEVVALSGTLGLDGEHLHIAVADKNGKTTGGHLGEGSHVFTTMEIVLGIYPQLTFKRVLDAQSGYKELEISQ